MSVLRQVFVSQLWAIRLGNVMRNGLNRVGRMDSILSRKTNVISTGWIRNYCIDRKDELNKFEKKKIEKKLTEELEEQLEKRSQQKYRKKKFTIPLQSQSQKIMTPIIAKSKQLQKKIITEPIKKIIPEHENIYTIPNMLTLTRLVAAPAVGYFIVKHQITIALPLFIYCCITDFVDGYLARRFNLKTIIGSIVDPMADKLLMVITTTALAISSYDFPVYLAVLILGKDILMGFAAIFIRYKTLPAPKTFKRYWDFSIPSVKVFPTLISKFNTGFQMVYITIAIFKPVIAPLLQPDSLELFNMSFEYFGYFVGFTTLLGGGSYLWSKDAVKAIK